MLSCASNAEGTWTCTLQRSGGSRAWIVWNVNGPKDFAVPNGWKVLSLRDLSGGKRTVTSGQTLSIGASPILLEDETSQ